MPLHEYSLEYSLIVLGGVLGAGLRYLLIRALAATPLVNCDLHPSYSLITFLQQQPFLIPNFLGCFIIGFLASALPFLPQIFPSIDPKLLASIYKAFTIGFCGCLTTFSTWLNTYTSDNFNKYWFSDLVVLGLEFGMTWSFFLLGLMLWDIAVQTSGISLASNEIVPEEENEADKIEGIVHADELGVDESHQLSIDLDSTPPTKNADAEQNQGKESSSGNQNSSDNSQHKNTERLQASAEEHKTNHSRHIISTWVKTIPFSLHNALYLLAIINWTSVFTFWILLIIDIYDNNRNYIFWSDFAREGVRVLALAPFGVSLRYTLAQLPLFTQTYPTLKLHTLTANIVGLTLAVIVSEYAPDWTWRQAFSDGVLGSLTTVSTWLTELHALYHAASSEKPFLPPSLVAIRYGAITVLLSLLLTQLLRLG